jgi:hypothetical protein
VAEPVKFKDFTRKRTPIFFTIEEERFDCIVGLPVETLQEVALRAGDVNNTNAYDSMKEFFKLVIQPESVDRLLAMMKDRDNPLEMEQATDIFMWLLEVYGLRPTTSSSGSSDGSPTDGAGTLSTVGASAGE